MNKSQLQEKLQHFILSDLALSVELYLLYLEEDGKIISHLPAAEENTLSPALSNLVKSAIKSRFFIEKENYHYDIVSANTAEANDIRQVYHIAKSEIPKASLIFDSIVDNTAEDFQKDLKLEDVWAYVFKVDSPSNGTIYLFKKNYPVNVLKKDNSYGLIFSNNMLKLFDKDLLRLSTHFDVMLIEKDLIILNRVQFEKAFDYVAAMQSSATKKIGLISKSKLIANLDKIISLSHNKRSLRKLLNINANSRILLKTPAQIVRLAKKYKMKFEVSEGGLQLSITTKKAAIAFVEMLNDDFLKSEFSGSLYKSKGKSEIKAKT